MFIEVLLALQSVTTNGHPVVGGIKNIGVVEFTHGLEFLECPGNLMVDIFATSQLTSDLVTNGHLVATFPHSTDRHLIT